MKRSVKILAIVLTLVMLCAALVSCGKTLSGEYSAEVFGSGIVFKFDGNKVNVKAKAIGAELGDGIDYTYSIEDDKITLTPVVDDEEAEEYAGTFDFEEGEDYIKIGEFGKLTKKD